jgi:hypothetical protein
MRKKRLLALVPVTVCIGVLTLALAPATTLAGKGGTPANPAWQSAVSSLSSNGQTLSVSFKEVGLGSQYTSDTITLSATVTSDWGCFTHSGMLPSATNKQGPGTVSNTDTFPARNGSVVGTISLTISSTLSCPPGQNRRLISASYTDIDVLGAAGDFDATPNSLFFP